MEDHGLKNSNSVMPPPEILKDLDQLAHYLGDYIEEE